MIDLTAIRDAAVIRPGDKLILRVDARLTRQQFDQLVDEVKERLPDIEILVVNVAQVIVYRPGTETADGGSVAGSAAHDTTSGDRRPRSAEDGLGDVGDRQAGAPVLAVDSVGGRA